VIDRGELDRHIDRLRAENPGRDDFIAAVRAFAETLDRASRELLGQALLAREPETGGFDVLNRRLEQGGWFQRTMRKIETRDRS
jgi:hypothetical protein